jgi:hypothetical protein
VSEREIPSEVNIKIEKIIHDYNNITSFKLDGSSDVFVNVPINL